MKVTLWGTRGSLATPGPETARYGGNTSMSGRWKRSWGAAIEAPPDERGGRRLCQTYCHRATSLPATDSAI